MPPPALLFWLFCCTGLESPPRRSIRSVLYCCGGMLDFAGKRSEFAPPTSKLNTSSCLLSSFFLFELPKFPKSKSSMSLLRADEATLPVANFSKPRPTSNSSLSLLRLLLSCLFLLSSSFLAVYFDSSIAFLISSSSFGCARFDCRDDLLAPELEFDAPPYAEP